MLYMQGLMLRLSQLDAHAANAMRVIGFFDRLLERRANLNTILRSAAELAECPIGFSSPDMGLSLRAMPDADPAPTPGVPHSAARKDLDDGTVVWLARAGEPAPLDEILLERLAIAIATRLDHASMPPPRLGDPALVELVLSQQAGLPERTRALHLLRIDLAAPLRVLAATDATTINGHAAKLGSSWAILYSDPMPCSVAGGTRLGIGPPVPAIDAARSWQGALTALRFTTASQPVVHAERLGCLTVLAERLDNTDLAQLADLIALDRIATEPSGRDVLAILDVLCVTGSVRKTAHALHRHHSTIPSRLNHASKALGFPVNTPTGRFRLQLALTLRKLRDNQGDRRPSPAPTNRGPKLPAADR